MHDLRHSTEKPSCTGAVHRGSITDTGEKTWFAVPSRTREATPIGPGASMAQRLMFDGWRQTD